MKKYFVDSDANQTATINQYVLFEKETDSGATSNVMINRINHVEFNAETVSDISALITDIDGIGGLYNWKFIIAFAEGAKMRKTVKSDGEIVVSGFDGSDLKDLKNAIVYHMVKSSKASKEDARKEIENALNKFFSEDGYQWHADNRHVNKLISMIGKYKSDSNGREGKTVTGNREIVAKSDNQIYRIICQFLETIVQIKLVKRETLEVR